MDKYCDCIKALRDLNRNLDDDYKKLSDKYHDLQLSHNRKKKALKCILEKISFKKRYHIEPDADWYFLTNLQSICLSALFSDGRERSRPLVKRKSKGGVK